MEQNGVVNFRHRRSPSSDRLLGVFSPSKTGSDLTAFGDSSASGDELNEDDVFWTGDFAEPQGHSSSVASQTTNIRQPFRQFEKFGILAALPEDGRKPNNPYLYRKASLSPDPTSFPKNSASPSPSPPTTFSRPIPSIPKPPSFNTYSQSMPVRKFQQSAPVNVPMMPRKAKNALLTDADIDDDEADDEMLPPHEIVSRGSAARSPKTTFSVLEGVGRTLKGRDLRQIRNAVLRQTGFLD